MTNGWWRAEYRKLYSRIVRMAPHPYGFGPKPDR